MLTWISEDRWKNQGWYSGFWFKQLSGWVCYFICRKRRGKFFGGMMDSVMDKLVCGTCGILM